MTGQADKLRRERFAATASPAPNTSSSAGEREALLALMEKATPEAIKEARRADLSGEDEAHAIGLRDGYERAVQDIDLMTGGDGEYRFCTDGDPDRHTPDAETMKARIAERFAVAEAEVTRLSGEVATWKAIAAEWESSARRMSARNAELEATITALRERVRLGLAALIPAREYVHQAWLSAEETTATLDMVDRGLDALNEAAALHPQALASLPQDTGIGVAPAKACAPVVDAEASRQDGERA